MPEIVAIGAVGALVVFIMVNLNLYFVHRQFSSPKISTLNHNLSSVKQYWSVERGNLISIPENSTLEETKMKDHAKATRSAFIFGTCMIFLSWVGFVFFIIYIFSVHKLAKSRLEKKIFASDLVKTKMDSLAVEKKLSEIISL
jgi:hypothetical protein